MGQGGSPAVTLKLDTWACLGSMLGEATQSRQVSLCELMPSLAAPSDSIELGIPTQTRTLICPAPKCPAASTSFELGIAAPSCTMAPEHPLLNQTVNI